MTLSTSTRIHCPDLIRGGRHPWTGTISELLQADGDRLVDRLSTLMQQYLTEEQYDALSDDWDEDAILAALEAADDATTIVQDLTDDPNAAVYVDGGDVPDHLAAYLSVGDIDYTVQEIERVTTALEAVDALHQEQDDEEQADSGAQEQATGATMWALGAETVLSLARQHQQALTQASAALDRLQGAVIAAHACGRSITDIAQDAGVTRQTIYTWLGRR